MLRIKRLLSLFLAISVLAVSLPVSSILLLALNTEVSYVIWDANPLNVTEEEGATAKPTWESYLFGTKTTGQSAVRYGGEMPYYELTFTGSGTANGALISSGFKYNWYNDKLGFTGWVSHRSVLEAIKPYLYVSYEVYVEEGTDNVSLTVQPQPKWGGDPTSDYGTFDEYENIPSGEWIERTVQVKEILHSADGDPHWSDAAVLISIDKEGVSAETPVKVSIRKLCLEIREEDREAVNSALAEVENIDKLSWFTGNYNGSSTVGDFPKQESGALDYFEGLIAYDAHSEYSPNLQTNNITDASTDENGTIKLSTYRTKAGNTVTVTAEPADGYRVKEIKAEDTVGDRTALVRTGPLTYSFVMPNSALTVTAVFESETAIEDKEYVIWDANPANLPEGSDGLAGKSGWINNKFSGNAEIKEDEDGAYYSLTVNTVGEAGMAGLFSGLIRNDGRMSGWQDDRVFVNALMQYATMSFEARRTDENSSTGEFEAGMASAWGGWDSARFGTIENGDALNTERNVWHSYSYSNLDEETTDMVSDSAGDHWSSGAFRFGAVSGDISEENPAVIDIRGMKLTLSEKDRLAFNQYLADIDYVRSGGWDWNNDFTPSLDVNGNPDYFGQLIKYDELSEYSPNLLTINDITDDENGNISISDTVLRAGETAVVTAFPKEGYRAELVTVISDEGKNILINRIEENKYSFAMPSGNVTVKAVFAEASENDNVSYVIWEADPKRFSLTDGTDASPSWTGADTLNFGSKVTGNSKVRYDEAIPYYEIEMTSAGETGGAVIDSGFVNTGHNNGDGFLGWVQSRKILEAMQGYLTVSYDIYVEDASGREVGIKIGPQPQYTNNSGYKDYGTFDTYENIPANIWISRTATVEEILHTENGDPHWACGDVIVSLTDSVVGVSSDSPITVRIRNLKLTVKEGDRAQLSSQLSAVEGIDAVNWFTLQWDGKTPFPDFPKNDDGSNNHYSALTAYDKVSAVATTFEKGDVNQDGAVDLKDLVRYKKYAADFTVKVNYSAADCDLNGSIEKAVDITALKKLLINGK